MGLGPPVCTKCRMLAGFSMGAWRCIFCGETAQDVMSNLWKYAPDEQKEIEANSEFVIMMLDTLREIEQEKEKGEL